MRRQRCQCASRKVLHLLHWRRERAQALLPKTAGRTHHEASTPYRHGLGQATGAEAFDPVRSIPQEAA
jgi:hypothetical protein